MAIYLDYAAATPLDPDVKKAMELFLSVNFHNPSALYGPALQAAKALALARADIAAELGVKPVEIIFTAGGTEANNLAIHGIMQQYPEAEVAFSAIEHDSVRAPASMYKHRIIDVTSEGLITEEAVVEAISSKTVLVSVMQANNEVGSIQPLKRISAIVEKELRRRREMKNDLPLYLHIDAAQAGNYLDLKAHRLKADLMTINGGKLYGPQQTGALYVASGIDLKPLISGGGQERGYRSGTENVAGAVGLAKALQISSKLRKDESQRLQEIQKNFINLIHNNFPKAKINGPLKLRMPNNVHVTFPKTDNERILMALDMKDIYAAAGSACSASHEEPSHVLKAMGLSSEDIRGSLRFTMGRQTTMKEIEQTVKSLKDILV